MFHHYEHLCSRKLKTILMLSDYSSRTDSSSVGDDPESSCEFPGQTRIVCNHRKRHELDISGNSWSRPGQPAVRGPLGKQCRYLTSQLESKASRFSSIRSAILFNTFARAAGARWRQDAFAACAASKALSTSAEEENAISDRGSASIGVLSTKYFLLLVQPNCLL